MSKAVLTFDVYSIDVWGNAEDGWEQNDYSRVASGVQVVAGATDADVLRCLQQEGLVNASLGLDACIFEWWGDDDCQLDGELRCVSDDRPIYQFRSVQP